MTFEEQVAQNLLNVMGEVFDRHNAANKTPHEPDKAFIAFSDSHPCKGESLVCSRVEQSPNGGTVSVGVLTSTVRNIQQLAGDVYMVTTRNSYYITKNTDTPEEDVRFAIIEKVPVIGLPMRCRKLETKDNKISSVSWITTPVQGINYFWGIYRIKTGNSTYFCFLKK